MCNKKQRDADPDADATVAAVSNPTNATFEITDTNLYVAVVALSIKNDNKLLEQLKTGFKKPLNGINIGHNWLNRLKLKICII